MDELLVLKDRQDIFLKNLREKTGKSHKQLEENPYAVALLNPLVSLSDFQLYIAKLFGFVYACERDVFPQLSAFLHDLDERKKSDHIIKDLIRSGISAEKIVDIPVFRFKPANLAQALGIMYVMEGSTLGGKIIYKHLHQILGIDAENGASYFWGYGEKTGIFWKGFITALAGYAVLEDCEDVIIASAVHTFSSLDQWFNEAEINL